MSVKKISPLRAIRANCLECSGDNMAEVKRCEIIDCPLWPFRMGHNPNRKGLGGSGRFGKPNSAIKFEANSSET